VGFWAGVIAWFGPVVDAVRGEVNGVELWKVIVTTVSAGGLSLGTVWAVLSAVGTNAPNIFVTKVVATVVASVISFALSYVHRASQGK
jgi:hypothetical protein